MSAHPHARVADMDFMPRTNYQGIVYTMIGERIRMDGRVVSRAGFHVKPARVKRGYLIRLNPC